VDALGEALERGLPCLLASPTGVVERFTLIPSDDESYHRAAVVDESRSDERSPTSDGSRLAPSVETTETSSP
jgi:hypothetical protein